LGFKRADRPAGGDDDLTLGRVVVRDYSNARVLDRLLMYERRIEHSLYRTMGELQKQRRMRELDPPAAGAKAGGGSEEVSSLKSEVSSEHPPLPEEVGRGRPTYQEPPEGGTPNVADAEEPSCETNPICTGSNEGQVPCGTGVRNDSCQGEVRETNPMCDTVSLRKENAHEHNMSGTLL
jgi:hypothetical protein